MIRLNVVLQIECSAAQARYLSRDGKITPLLARALQNAIQDAKNDADIMIAMGLVPQEERK